MSARGVAVSAAPLSRRAVFLTVGLVLLVLAVLAWLPVLIDPEPVPVPNPPLLAVVMLIAGFVIAELLPLRVQVRRELILVSLSEMPLVWGILLVPAWVVGACFLGAGLLVYLIRREGVSNIVMNAALIAAESGAAVLIVNMSHAATATGDLVAAGGRFGPVSVGVLIGAVLSAVAVAVAYRLIGPAEPVVRAALRALLTAAVIVGLALVAYTVWNSPLGGPVLAVLLLVVVAVIYWSYAAFVRQHTDLAEIYEFGTAVARARGDVANWQQLLARVREQVGASLVVLHLPDAPAGAHTLAMGIEGPVDVPLLDASDAILAAASAEGSFLATSGQDTVDAGTQAALRSRDAWDVMAVPLRSGDRDRGYLEARNSQGKWRKFSHDDLPLIQAMGGHLSTALDNFRLMERMSFEAYHDAVTGLLNRAGLLAAASECARADAFGGFLVFELDVLLDVNSALGHGHGDQLLNVIGDRLVSVAGGQCPAARIERDRFAVLVENQTEDSVLRVADEIIAAVGARVATADIEIEPHVIAGVALRSGADLDNEELLQRAEVALAASRTGDQALTVYRAAMGETYQRRFQLVTQFRKAVDSGRVSLHYQPKLSLADRQLIGVEALVRWNHPEYGFVSPAELIDAIENTPAIDLLFSHVLDTALAQIVQWQASGWRIAIAVNMSVRNLLSPGLIGVVTEALERHQAPAELLTLEITESSVMDQPERALPILQELHSIGIDLSVDDFGTGYSSLAYLRRLPIDEIKIDKSFVQGMVTDLGDLAIVRAIIDLGHSLGLQVLAEGVEEEACRDALRSMRCDAMQGFLLSRPLPIDRFDRWLASRAVTGEDSSKNEPALLRIRT